MQAGSTIGRILSGRVLPKRDLVIYELHVGTFTASGTFLGCVEKLPYLKNLGITAIELLPVAQCPGRWNWGYDGVGLFSVNHNYGTPRDFKKLVNECHKLGIAVILDVVYNHLGPEGNYLGAYGDYTSKKHATPWGDALNFDDKNCDAVREFVVENALYWLSEYHLDGLRLDALHFMKDESDYSIQQEICDRVRAFERQGMREIHLIGETNVYDHSLVASRSADQDNAPREFYSALWADDLMHSVFSVADVLPISRRESTVEQVM